MTRERFGALMVLLLLLPASVPAGDRPGLTGSAGASVNGVFFPYSVEGMTFEAASTEKPGCRCSRVLGPAVGGTVGFFGYAPFALSDGRVGVSDTQRLLEWSAVTAGTAYLGYLIARKLDGR